MLWRLETYLVSPRNCNMFEEKYYMYCFVDYTFMLKLYFYMLVCYCIYAEILLIVKFCYFVSEIWFM